MAQRVAVIEGEDASPEAVRPTVALIDALGLEPGIEWVYPPVGQLGIEQYGSTFPAQAREQIDSCETTLFGSDLPQFVVPVPMLVQAAISLGLRAHQESLPNLRNRSPLVDRVLKVAG